MTASKGNVGMLVLEINVCLICFSRSFQISFFRLSLVSPLSSWRCLQRLCEGLRANSEKSTEWNIMIRLHSCRGWPPLCCRIFFCLLRCLKSKKKRHHEKSTKTRRNPTEVLNFYKRDTEAFLSQHFYYYRIDLPLSLKAFLESFGKMSHSLKSINFQMLLK